MIRKAVALDYKLWTRNDEIITQNRHSHVRSDRVCCYSNSFFLFTANQMSNIRDKVDNSNKFN